MWSTSEVPLPSRRQLLRGVVRLLTTVLLLAGGLALPVTVTTVHAAQNQAGGVQVLINGGGGAQLDGSDGLRIVLNRDTDGHDDYRRFGTSQEIANGFGPALNIGGELFGQAGPAASSTNWSSITVVATTGSAGTGSPTSTGSGSATLRYVAEKAGRTYILDRRIDYTYPADFATDTYTLTIPAGNTDLIRLYRGGDAAPGGGDNGTGLMVTAPRRSVSEIGMNVVNGGFVELGFREVAGSQAFDGATAQGVIVPYGAVVTGSGIGFVANTAPHDAGLMVQFDLGTTPGTRTVAMESFVRMQGGSIRGSLPTTTVNVGDTFTYVITGSNSSGSYVATDVKMPLPDGLRLDHETDTGGGCSGAFYAGPGTTFEWDGSIKWDSDCEVTLTIEAQAEGVYSFDGVVRPVVTGAAANVVAPATLTVHGPATWTDRHFAAMQVGVPYSDAIGATGFPDTITYAITAGALPPGLSLNTATGAITGTPTLAGSFNVSFNATNGVGAPVTDDETFVVAPAASTGGGGSGEGGGGGGTPGPVGQAGDRGYLPIVPVRLLDTRDGGGAPFAAGSVHEIAIAGLTVPTDRTAAVINVAVDQPASAGYVTVYPCGTTPPVAANLNFTKDQTTSNGATSFVGSNGAVCVYVSATTHVIVDLDGVYSPSAGTGLVAGFRPERLADTRLAGSTIVTGGTTLTVPVRGHAGLTASTTAAVLNVAVDDPTAAGYLTVYPCGSTRPVTANLNFGAHRTTSNAVVSGLGPDGDVCVYASVTTHVIVDIGAAYGPTNTSGHLLPTTLARVLDTRDGGAARLAAGTVQEVLVVGTQGLPAGSTAVAINLAVDQAAADGFVTVYPCGSTLPVVANLNYAAGDTKSNAALVGVGDGGKICLYSLSSTHIIVDVDATFGPVA